MSLSDIQKKAKLSSSSLASYHVSKLLDQGLILEKDEGYLANSLLFESMIRIRRSVVPLHTTFSIFFATTLGGLLFLHPQALTSTYLLAISVNLVALAISLYQMLDTLGKWKAPEKGPM